MLFLTPPLGSVEIGVIREVEALRRNLAYAAAQPKRWYGLLARNTLARAVQGSNAIEGYHATMEEAVAIIDEEPPIDPRDETWMALNGYRAAMTFVLQKGQDAFFLFTTELLKALHFMMTGYDLKVNPGLFRPGPIYVRDEATGKEVYEGPPREMVSALMNELIAGLNVEDDTPAVVRAAMAHLNLVMIHPFSDGNGRMARCLQTLVLGRSGIAAPMFSSIEEYLGSNTADYCSMLGLVGQGSWHPENDARPWIRFCLTAHYRQAMTLQRRTREIQKLCDELEALVGRMRLPERSVMALADAAMGFKARNQTYRRAADVSEAVAGRDLKALAEAGLLEPKGEKRGRHYVATPLVYGLWKKAQEDRSPIPDPFDERAADSPRQELLPLMTEPGSVPSEKPWPQGKSTR